MKHSEKKRKYPMDSILECRKRRAARHAKQVEQDHQAQREMKQESNYAWH